MEVQKRAIALGRNSFVLPFELPHTEAWAVCSAWGERELGEKNEA
jgi:hypothetical protein